MTIPTPADWSAAREEYRQLVAERKAALEVAIARFVTPGRDIVWELGSGHGHFLAAYAQAHPEKLCVGVDIVSERVERALRKRDRAKLTNLDFFHTEARLFLDVLPAGTSLSDVFILFPDPWPKLRHHKHRIIQPAFLDRVAARAGGDCRLNFRTDHTPYYEATLAMLSAHRRWRIADEAWPFEHPTVFQSRAASFHSLVARVRS
jgi:tRNA (guanine-N7-)-methyltransferase